MLYDKVSRLLEWRATLLMAGRFEDLTREHLFPMPVYVGSRVQSLSSERQLEHIFRAIRIRLAEMGATSLTISVKAMDLPRQGRIRVWSDWLAQLPDGTSRVVSSTVDYMQLTPGGLRTEMLECRRPARLPDRVA